MAQNRHQKCTAEAARLSGVECVLVVFVLVLLVAAVLIGSAHAAPEFDTATVRVGAGDTLWSLARTHPLPGMSTGEAVELLAEINGLDDATLLAGSTVKVPIVRQESAAVAMR